MMTRTLRLMTPALIPSLAAALVVVLVSPLPVSAQEESIEIRLLVFSGRPDPEITLSLDRDRESIAAIRAILDEARPIERTTKDPLIPSILGYRGIAIRNSGEVAELPTKIAVYRGVIQVGEDRFLSDPDRRLERLVVQMAVERDLVDAELLEAEKLN